MSPEPGYANLRLLGHDASPGHIYAPPAGVAERVRTVWAFDVPTGKRLLSAPLQDPDTIWEMYLAPDFKCLAISQTDADSGRPAILTYELVAKETEPRSCAPLSGTHGDHLRWSPDSRWLAFLLRKRVLEGLTRMRLERACTLYERGQLNLSGAARHAGIGIEQMMRELTRRGIDHSPSVEQFVEGLETLADLFDKDQLRRAAAVRRQQRL